MRSGTWLSLGALGWVVIACGGGVSLGNAGSGLEGLDAGTDSGPLDCSAPNACGAASLEVWQCADGSIGGYGGHCIAKPGGGCGWEVRNCPPAPVCFDPLDEGRLFPAMRACATSSDCAIVTYRKDCCGSMHVAGVSAMKATTLEDCAAKLEAELPACECAASAATADDGTTGAEGGTAKVTCTAAGLCATTFEP